MKIIITTILLSLILIGNAQISLSYSRVKINLQTCSSEQLARLGLEVDHGDYAPGKHLINDYSSDEIALLAANSIDHEIIIADVKQWYVDQNKPGNEHFHDHKTGSCGSGGGGNYSYTTPANYQYGSMGGYLTYSEMLVELDKMTSLYPNLISPKTPISNTVLTHEGLPIYYLRISDNPNTDEPEPEALYTALHHAREPNSLAQMVFYMWYLLENYSTDPEIHYLVNQTELYFVPCVNPDGYLYNEQTNPNGGGLWRKNRKSDVGGIVHGVDLNRNYGYEWGHDNSGSSPNINSETYRGDSGFSEPETQNLKLFCDAHQFKIALNYHCYGNLLIYPWGYNNQPTNDNQTFVAMSDAMTRENNFFAGTSTQTVGYLGNGVSDDWMYGEMTSKPAIFSMTPEVGPGSYGFWPPQSAIDELNKSCLKQNLVTAHLLLNYGIASEISPQSTIDLLNGDIDIAIEKLGLANGPLTLQISPLTSNLTINTSPQVLNMTPWTKDSITFSYTLDNTTMSGDSVVYLVALNNGLYTFTDTIVRQFGGTNDNVIYSEDGNDLSEWQLTGNWEKTNEAYVSAIQSITDSPYTDYSNNSTTSIRLTTVIDLSTAIAATATFFAKWEIESDYDFVQFQAAPVGGSYTALCGLYTETGQNTQPAEPVYDGFEQNWVQESVSLDDYLGGQVQLQFIFVSDGAVREDGFYFDDFAVSTVEPISTDLEDLDKSEAQLSLQPNPASNAVMISINTPSVAPSYITIYNGLGQSVYQQSFVSFTEHQLEIASWAPGLYFVEYRSGNQNIVEKLVVH